MSNNKFTGTQGPIRATSHIAISNRFDYQPDVCKDYKETGYCAFGDSCIFLHDRGDYKSGWEIVGFFGISECRSVIGTESRRRSGNGGNGESRRRTRTTNTSLKAATKRNCPSRASSADNHLRNRSLQSRFGSCLRRSCGHYFCEKCALDHYRTTSKCFVCGKDTNGCFNKATDIIARIQKMQQEEVSGSGSEDEKEINSDDE